jgi:hypothetical protein
VGRWGRLPRFGRRLVRVLGDRSGIGLFELSRLMGTSVEQIDTTYGHLLPDSLDRARATLEAFGHGAGTDTAMKAL